MTAYIALLKGINVGGNNILKMADLKEYLAATGLNAIRTYIQSGNILFESAKDEKTLKRQIEEKIQEKSGRHIPVILRTAKEWKQIVDQCPYTKEQIETAEAATRAAVFYLFFFSEPLDEENTRRLSDIKTNGESFKVIGKNIYLLLDDSIRNSKLAAALSKITIANTARNWKTVNTLLSMATVDN